MQTAPVFKQASIRPGNKTVPAHLVLFRAGSLRGTVQEGLLGGGGGGEGWGRHKCSVRKTSKASL